MKIGVKVVEIDFVEENSFLKEMVINILGGMWIVYLILIIIIL